MHYQVSTHRDPEDKCIVILGEGTHQQIQILRKEILKLIHFDRAMSYGAFRSKANMYVMDGATMLYARRAESQQCMLALEPYVNGQVNRAHRDRSSASILTMRSACCDDDTWIKTFQDAFVTKVRAIFSLIFTYNGGNNFSIPHVRQSISLWRWTRRPVKISYFLFTLENFT